MKITSLDSSQSLCGTYFQQTGESIWNATNAANLIELLNSGRPPEFRTILGIQNHDLDKLISANDWHAVRYSGPFYVDFDAGDDLPHVCEQFKRFITKLNNSLGFDLNQARFFASGAKGFHLEIPQECFMPNVRPEGTAWLPYIYRYMAQELAVETLDLNVYSGKRGRMWRIPNRKRSNGKFKVPLTLDEAQSITHERYKELIRSPRPFPELAGATLNSKFAMLFSTCKDTVVGKMAPKMSKQRVNNALRARFRGKLPPSLEAIARGDIPSQAGFNKLAMQLCITAHAVGMSEAELLSTCAGLLKSHHSDTTRYNTSQKRDAELRRLYTYFAENPYEFSVAGIRSIFPRGMRADDLRGL